MTWHNSNTNPPPIFVDVLLAVRGELEAAEGWRNPAGEYVYSTGHDVKPGHVYAWTPMPDIPSPAEIGIVSRGRERGRAEGGRA